MPSRAPSYELVGGREKPSDEELVVHSRGKGSIRSTNRENAQDSNRVTSIWARDSIKGYSKADGYGLDANLNDQTKVHEIRGRAQSRSVPASRSLPATRSHPNSKSQPDSQVPADSQIVADTGSSNNYRVHSKSATSAGSQVHTEFRKRSSSAGQATPRTASRKRPDSKESGKSVTRSNSRKRSVSRGRPTSRNHTQTRTVPPAMSRPTSRSRPTSLSHASTRSRGSIVTNDSDPENQRSILSDYLHSHEYRANLSRLYGRLRFRRSGRPNNAVETATAVATAVATHEIPIASTSEDSSEVLEQTTLRPDTLGPDTLGQQSTTVRSQAAEVSVTFNTQFLPITIFMENIFKPQYYFSFFCNICVHSFTQLASAIIFVTFWMTTVGIAFPPMLPVVLPHALIQSAIVAAICCRSYVLEFMESYVANLLWSDRGFLFSSRAAFSWIYWFWDMPLFLWKYFTLWAFYITLILLTFIPYLGPLLVLLINARATGVIYYSKAQESEMTRDQIRGKKLDLFMFGGTAFLLEWFPIIGGVSYSTNLSAARKMVKSDLGLEEMPNFTAISTAQ